VGLRIGSAEGGAEAAVVGVRVGGVDFTPVSPSIVVVPPAGIPETPALIPTPCPAITAMTAKATTTRTRTAVTVHSTNRRLYPGLFTGGPLILS
jgi:L-serine deaminase